MANKFIEQLYDIAESKDEKGLSKFDESKLRRYLDSNKKLLSRNKDMFEREEGKFFSCRRYDPCPICDKCLNKASHLYVSCQTCQIPICTHTYKDRLKMINRNNFSVKVDKEIFESQVE